MKLKPVVIGEYDITEYGEEENGVNSIAFHLVVDDIFSDYGFSILCMVNEMKLINFIDIYVAKTVNEVKGSYSDKIEKEIKAAPAILADFSDSELFEMAYDVDGYDYAIGAYFATSHVF